MRQPIFIFSILASLLSVHAALAQDPPKMYILMGPDRKFYVSPVPGTVGGHRRLRIYGRLDCPSANRWLAKGYYKKYRVFFANEADAIAAGFRPCKVCMPERWLSVQETIRAREIPRPRPRAVSRPRPR